MEKHPLRKAKVYGKRSTAPAATAPIFAQDTPYPTAPISQTRALSPVRHVLDDLTYALSNVRLDTNEIVASQKQAQSPKAKRQTKNSNIIIPVPEESKCRKTRAATSKKPAEDLRLNWLKPLIDAYRKDGRPEMAIRKWDNILDENWRLEKIAESSYAEVYKVANNEGTSVLKIMALKPPKGPGSQRETAVTVESVVSEVLIMDMMAEIPGFLEFKDAHIIEGKPPKAITEAYEVHAAKTESFFPKPGAYHRAQLFLALELGDAGLDIEHFKIINTSQLWDIFLRTTFALANGESEFKFEHRDLHEGNVCVKQVSKAKKWTPGQLHKLGYSGLEITLLDYTLSRAQEKTVVYRDLELDFELFNESDLLQHQMYRRMRIWAFFRSHGIKHPLFDSKETPAHGSWEAFMPYTNVIWLHYLLETIITRYEGKESLDEFKEETEKLREKISPDKRSYDGGFESAEEVLEYCVVQGWIGPDDLMD